MKQGNKSNYLFEIENKGKTTQDIWICHCELCGKNYELSVPSTTCQKCYRAGFVICERK